VLNGLARRDTSEASPQTDKCWRRSVRAGVLREE
jgi:hypothetical protein